MRRAGVCASVYQQAGAMAGLVCSKVMHASPDVIGPILTVKLLGHIAMNMNLLGVVLADRHAVRLRCQRVRIRERIAADDRAVRRGERDVPSGTGWPAYRKIAVYVPGAARAAAKGARSTSQPDITSTALERPQRSWASGRSPAGLTVSHSSLELAVRQVERPARVEAGMAWPTAACRPRCRP
jgi:hypothetical protein